MNKYIENIKIEKIDNSNERKNFILHVYLSKDVIDAPFKVLRKLFDDDDKEIKEINYKSKKLYIYIPEGIECIKESLFENAFNEYGYGDTTVIIPEGVKKIEKRAFYYARFHSLKLPESLEYIGEEALYTYSADKMEGILISKNVKHIGQNVFSGNIKFDKENKNFFDDGVAVYNELEKSLVYFYPDVKKEVYLVKEGTEKISASGIFRKSYFIDEIIIPQSVKKIEKCLWRYNEFKKVTVQNKETLIRVAAFEDNTKILYPDGKYFYMGHSSKFYKEENDKKYHNYQNTKVTQARRNAIEKIEEEENSLNIYFSENIQSDEGIVFRHLLQNDYDNVSEQIKKRYVEGYYHDIYVYLPDGINTVKQLMFSNAFVNQKDNNKISSKVHIIIGEGVEKIEKSVFWNSGAYSVKLPQSLEVIEKNAFHDTSITQNIKIPKGVRVIEEGAFCINGEAKILVDKDNQTFYSDGHALYNIEEKELIYFFAHKWYKDYKEFDEAYNFNYRVISGTKKIQIGAFEGFSYYDSDVSYEERFGVLELPESLEKVERWTFYETDFKKVIINNPHVIIENYAFLNGQRIEFPYDGYLIIKNYDDVKIDDEYKIVVEISEEDKNKYNKVIYDYEVPEEKAEPEEVYQGEETELDIDEIKRKLEENKEEAQENQTAENPFDFDADEIFKDINYDYNPFDFKPVDIEDDDEDDE
ncbi:MAG: hypothetical protein E7404_00415 [Ruminococcaceae bacterium]|nr:hypothetical protein [Oscillospiraceae bacterium]